MFIFYKLKLAYLNIKLLYIYSVVVFFLHALYIYLYMRIHFISIIIIYFLFINLTLDKIIHQAILLYNIKKSYIHNIYTLNNNLNEK
jgi:hypothetical protein